MRSSKTLAVLFILALAASATESTNRRSEWKIPSSESFIVRSSADQHEFEIMVALPRRYAESDAKYPVLYVLDGNGTFPLAVESARFLEFDSPQEEPLIVGIGYPVGLFWNTLGQRLRDFSPTADPEFVRQLGSRFDFAPQGSGGAEAFLAFLAGELIPALESRYRIDGRRRALHGYSLGGLFATYVLFMQPELFQSYLIGAPGLWSKRNVTLELEQAFAKTHDDLRARVFLTVGLLDSSRVPIAEKLEQALRSRKYAGLTWRSEYFQNETHNSAIPVTLTRGIRWLYGDLAPMR